MEMLCTDGGCRHGNKESGFRYGSKTEGSFTHFPGGVRLS